MERKYFITTPVPLLTEVTNVPKIAPVLDPVFPKPLKKLPDYVHI
jgi:hypothetical protein